MTRTSTEQLEPRYADVVHHANVHPSLSYVARKTGLGYQETTRLLELALARGDLASGDYAGRNLDLYVADREKALTQEVEQLCARVQELEAERTARMTQNDRMAERIAELEAQVQRAAEAERAAILLRVKNRAVAGALLVEDFRSIVADRAPAAPVPQAPCVICGSDEPYTGTCGSNDPRALCKQPAAPQPPEAAPVQLPEPAAWVFKDRTWTEIRAMAVDHDGVPAYTEQQVRDLLAAHGIGGAA